MSEQAKHDKQAVIDAVVGSDLAGLVLALKRLSDSSPSEFLGISHDLLNTEQREQFPLLGSGHLPAVYHADGKVFGATYTNGGIFCKRAHPAGTGLPFDEVRQSVEAVRVEFEQLVRDCVTGLKGQFEQIYRLLEGHSFADSTLVSLAHADLVKGQALLVAALAGPPVKTF